MEPQPTTSYKITNYKDLIVYQKAKENGLRLIKHYANEHLLWTEKYLVDQLIRAATSVCANLAEGYGRLYKQEYRRFVSIARGSSFEAECWIDFIIHARPQDKKFLEEILNSNTEVVKMLTAMMRKMELTTKNTRQ